ncbi:MAG: DUF3108 domain-containing protein [Burkholderiaceae bacterium]|nr:DUF3108 domain-containing protein [Sulfuritalea sp.]MCF8176626.1 DUF3108 domain-containing protein [Burkholderiaceae bacterium]
MIEMPLTLALLASALLHVLALLGPGWQVPGSHEPDVAVIDAVLRKPAAPTPALRPAPRPPVKAARPQPVLPPPAAVAATEPFPVTEPVAAQPSAAPVLAAAEPPVAVAPAPTFNAPPLAIALPAKGRLRYSIIRGDAGFEVGQTTHTWEHDGFNYQLQSVTETTGIAALFKPARVVQSSQGEVTAAGLRPREFRHERVKGLDTASFDWARNVVSYAGQEDAIVAGTQDMLSMYYQLVLMGVKSGTLEMPIATGRKLENYRFEIVGEETVSLPEGKRRATRLKSRSSGADTIEVWIAPEQPGLPVRIRFTDRKGEVFDQLAHDIAPQETQ